MSSSAPDPFLTTQHAYEADAQGWAEARNDRSAVKPYIETFARLTGQGARVLDVGCGPGFDTVGLVKAGLAPVALDFAGAMARLAAKQAPGAVVQSDARHLPFVAASFHGVWASASLLH